MLQHAATCCTMLQYLYANAGRPAFGSSAKISIYQYAMHVQGPKMMIALIITLGEIMYYIRFEFSRHLYQCPGTRISLEQIDSSM